MTLLAKDIQSILPPLYSQNRNADPLVFVRFFDCLGDWSWYAAEFDGTNLFFGVVLGLEREVGYFSLTEFEEVNRSAGFERIKHDPDFEPAPISEIRRRQ